MMIQFLYSFSRHIFWEKNQNWCYLSRAEMFTKRLMLQSFRAIRYVRFSLLSLVLLRFCIQNRIGYSLWFSSGFVSGTESDILLISTLLWSLPNSIEPYTKHLENRLLMNSNDSDSTTVSFFAKNVTSKLSIMISKMTIVLCILWNERIGSVKR